MGAFFSVTVKRAMDEPRLDQERLPFSNYGVFVRGDREAVDLVFQVLDSMDPQAYDKSVPPLSFVYESKNKTESLSVCRALV